MKKVLFALIAPLAVLACGQKDNPSGGGGSDEPASGLAKPTNVVMTEATESTLSFSWDAVSGADSYGYKLTASGQKTVTGTVTVTSVKVEGLKEATEYSFQVLAMAGDKKSLYSNAVKAKTASSTVDPGDEPGDLPTICVDQPLVFSLNTTPKLGTSGLIQVFDANDKLVDKIDMADMATVTVRADGTMVPKEKMTAETPFNTFMDAILGTSGGYRVVHYTPIRVQGNTVEVKLHNSKLAFGGSYYVTVDESVFGLEITKDDAQAFTVKEKPAGTTLSVRVDGTGDFCTLQGALSYAATLSKDAAVTVNVGEGTYREILYLRNKNNVTIKGAGADKSQLVYANTENLCSTTGSRVGAVPALGAAIGNPGGRSIFLVEGCDNLVLEGLSIVNDIASGDGQAECLYFNGDGKKLVIEGCSLISWQDTFETKGLVYVHNSLIAGHVDFIWGNPSACLFEDCEIRSRESGRYIVQARCKSGDKGFVFLNCSLTVESGVSNVNLARANDHAKEEEGKKTFDNVTYVNCTMTGVAAAGWHTSPAPNPGTATATDGWKEYGSKDASGNALSLTGRASCARILTAAEAEPFSSKQAVLGW